MRRSGIPHPDRWQEGAFKSLLVPDRQRGNTRIGRNIPKHEEIQAVRPFEQIGGQCNADVQVCADDVLTEAGEISIDEISQVLCLRERLVLDRQAGRGEQVGGKPGAPGYWTPVTGKQVKKQDVAEQGVSGYTTALQRRGVNGDLRGDGKRIAGQYVQALGGGRLQGACHRPAPPPPLAAHFCELLPTGAASG